MKFDILTLFPTMFAGPFSESIIKRAVDNGLIEIVLHNIRDYAVDKHKTTDDSPYGGGAGMVMKAEPLSACIESVKADGRASKVILTTPQGRPINHATAKQLAEEDRLIIICGRYEGVDDRVKTLFVDYEISLGDFVLTGGELVAMALVDAVSRFIPGVLGSAESVESDSFADGLLEYPHYTRPPEFRGLPVPPVLMSGNHAEIASWRRRQALSKTRMVRPDLLAKAVLTKEDEKFLKDPDPK
jgi:tRNA (guanine37-N1)-methyltransferase